MKKVVVLVAVSMVVLSSCGVRPYYKTAEGRRKQKHYNELQFGGKSETVMHSYRK